MVDANSTRQLVVKYINIPLKMMTAYKRRRWLVFSERYARIRAFQFPLFLSLILFHFLFLSSLNWISETFKLSLHNSIGIMQFSWLEYSSRDGGKWRRFGCDLDKWLLHSFHAFYCRRAKPSFVFSEPQTHSAQQFTAVACTFPQQIFIENAGKKYTK